ncbi:FAD/FMN-containing dehydrogenase [Pseudooceanicola antarcticus]|uniref:FAD-binding oxidoreductase n=1 Tax=Pseudooceanicola antarcticus TaxID=1247613 RepID=A0A285IMR4_9RHOB|nr:FAD-binding oxidoreductase [Pseudooceanicola antarcticus]PJE28785.1 FAD-binding oxidoreductase [Pseudooceanicola antarcticus]SNY48251.1 FAD/FMN-containing dehydrogenase [Pseudooceanicola antarcticus]
MPEALLLAQLAGHDLAPLTAPRDTARFSTDATRRGGAQPRLVLRPVNTAGVSAALAACFAVRRPIIVQGGLTGLSGGARPRAGEVVLSLERMTNVAPVDRIAAQVEVQAGATLQSVQQVAQAQQMIFGVDLGARASATIGGMIATNAGGIRVLRYGMMRAQVAGLEAVLPDGSVIDAMRGLEKDNAGPDLRQLFIGSEGTHGVITRALLRLHPAPSLQINALCAVPDAARAQELLAHMRARLGPLLSACEGIWPEVYEGAAARIGTPPLPPGAGLYVLLEVQGMAEVLREEAFEAALIEAYEAGLCSDIVVSQSASEYDKLWALREACVAYTFSLGELVAHDLSLPARTLPEFLDAARSLLARIDPEAQPFVFGHIGDGNLHYIVNTGKGSEVTGGLNALAASMGGSITAEHGLGQDKVRYLPLVRTETEIALLRRLRAALNPADLLGQGRVLPPE